MDPTRHPATPNPLPAAGSGRAPRRAAGAGGPRGLRDRAGARPLRLILLLAAGTGLFSPLAAAEPPAPAEIAGTVTDQATGEPVPRVAVVCRFLRDGAVVETKAETDSGGRYRVVAPAGCAVALEFAAAGYARWHRGPFVPGGRPWLSGDVAIDRKPVTLTPDKALVTGVVLDAATGGPVRGIAVDLCLWGGAHHPDFRTDPRGRFTIEMPAGEDRAPPGRILVRAAGFLAYGSVEFPFAAGERTHLEICLLPGKTLLRGLVTDGAGDRPVPGAQVAIDGEVGSEFGRAAVAEDGTFEVEIPPGTVVVRASAPGYEAASAETEVEGGTTGSLRIALRRIDSVVAGTCLDLRSGRPVEEAQVQVFGDFWPGHEAMTDANGAFRCAVPAGGWRVLAAKEGYRPALQRAESTKDGVANVVLGLAPLDSAIVAAVVDDATGGPVRGGVDVRIESLDAGLADADGVVAYPEFDFDPAAGGFEAAVAPGKFRITIDGSTDYLFFDQEFEVAPQEQHALRIALTPMPPRTAEVRAVVVPPAGTAVEALTVIMEYARTPVLQALEVSTDAPLAARVPAGTIHVSACGSCRRGDGVVMLSGEATVEAVAGRTVEVQVRLAEAR